MTDLKQLAVEYMNGGGRPGVIMDSLPMQMSTTGNNPFKNVSLNDSMAFLVGELEKIEPKLLEPLSSVTYARDMILKPGGGWVQYASTIDVEYSTTGGNANGIQAPSSNAISRVQAKLSKDTYQVFNFVQAYSCGFINNQLVNQTGRNLEDIFNKGIKLNYDKSLDYAVYFGFKEYGTTGLVNNPNVARYTVKTNGDISEPSTVWDKKTPDQILDDFNDLINTAWEAGGFSPDALINHILISPQRFGHIVSKKVSEAADKSILKYVLENNIAAMNGVELKIFPCRQCIGMGENKTERMIGYVNVEDKINVDVTVPLTRIMTGPNMNNASIDNIYAGQFSEVKMQYLQTIAYADGI